MYRSSIEILKIDKLRVKFGIIVKDDPLPNKRNIPTLNKFLMKGDHYFNVTPHPFITIDISGYESKSDGWNPNSTFTLNRRNRDIFVTESKKFIESFKIKELYYNTYQNKLVLNKEVSDKYSTKIVTLNKTLMLRHGILVSEGEPCEGVILMINNVSSYSTMPYDDFVFMVKEIAKIDMTQLALSLINTTILYEIFHNMPKISREEKKIVEVLTEKKEEPKDKAVILSKEKTIPDLK